MHINICSLVAVPGPKVPLVQCGTGSLLHC